MHLYAFCSNFCPKIGCHGNVPLPLEYGSVTDEFSMAQTLSQNQTAWMCRLQVTTEVVAIFVIFGQNLVATATSLRPLQSEMFYLDWLSPKTIPENQKFCQ